MTIGQLRTFLSVARHQSVSRAAAELVVTQPAVSASIAALERSLAVTLVVREGRKLSLTPAGETLARYAAECLALLEQARTETIAAAQPGRGRLRVAAVTTAGEYIVPPLLKAFHQRYPEVEVALEVGNRRLVLERLREREADAGVGGRPPEGGHIDGRPFLANPLVVVVAADHPLALAGAPAIAPERLGGETWLLREPGSGSRATTEQYLTQHGLQPSRVLTLGSNGAVKQAAVVGLGIALIPAQAVSVELALGTLARLPVRGTPLRRRWFLLSLQGAFLPGAAAAFLEFATTMAARRAVRRALAPAPRLRAAATPAGSGTGGTAG